MSIYPVLLQYPLKAAVSKYETTCYSINTSS